MKKILSLLAVFSLFFSLSVPANAVSVTYYDYGYGTIAPELPPALDGYPYVLMTEYQDAGYYALLYSQKPAYVTTGLPKLYLPAEQTVVQYIWNPDNQVINSWEYSNTDYIDTDVFAGAWRWTNSPLYKTDGTLKYEYIEPVLSSIASSECDGTACPATDANYDNICDDCGKVLTLSLRSTLLEYANSVVANGMNIFDSEYWLITDNGDGGYKVYVSSVPFRYNASSGTVTSTGVVQRTEVYDTSDGSYIGGTSWASKQPNTALDVGSPVATSHPIEGFFPIPLWMEMDRLTQGEMVTMGQTLGGMMKILVPCGVGCLALLMVLKLFGKRSLISRS